MTNYPRIIAVRTGRDTYLVETSEGRGVVYSLHSSAVSPEMKIDAFIKFGYWEEFDGSMTVGELLKQWKRKERHTDLHLHDLDDHEFTKKVNAIYRTVKFGEDGGNTE